MFLAEDTRLERKAAIKFLPRETASNPEFRQRFLREAKAASALKQRFFERVYDLAYDACQVLKTLKRVRAQETSSFAGDPNRHWVYLATTTSDVQDERDRIKRELLERGHVVLPDAALPMVSSNVETAVKQYLDKCTIAIHMLGRHYGVTPEDSSESIPALQVRLTADWSRANDLQRLVWLPGDGQSQDERQQAFIERVQEDPALHDRAEVIEGNLNLLKKDLIRRLNPPEEKPKPTANSAGAAGPAKLYLICDPRDEADVESLEDYLFFGREEQTIELLSRLSDNRFVAVVGTSGSGKSSLVRCGLLSELLGGKMLQAGAAWEIAVTHPGGNPLALLPTRCWRPTFTTPMRSTLARICWRRSAEATSVWSRRSNNRPTRKTNC